MQDYSQHNDKVKNLDIFQQTYLVCGTFRLSGHKILHRNHTRGREQFKMEACQPAVECISKNSLYPKSNNYMAI
jgi:hypothetical protein